MDTEIKLTAFEAIAAMTAKGFEHLSYKSSTHFLVFIKPDQHWTKVPPPGFDHITERVAIVPVLRGKVWLRDMNATVASYEENVSLYGVDPEWTAKHVYPSKIDAK